jgi:hypothetical protein
MPALTREQAERAVAELYGTDDEDDLAGLLVEYERVVCHLWFVLARAGLPRRQLERLSERSVPDSVGQLHRAYDRATKRDKPWLKDRRRRA